MLQIYPEYKPYAVAEPHHGPSMLSSTELPDHSKYLNFMGFFPHKN